MKDISQIMRQAQAMQAKISEAQKSWRPWKWRAKPAAAWSSCA